MKGVQHPLDENLGSKTRVRMPNLGYSGPFSVFPWCGDLNPGTPVGLEPYLPTVILDPLGVGPRSRLTLPSPLWICQMVVSSSMKPRP